MSSFDLTQLKVVTVEDLESAVRAGASLVTLRAGAIVTPAARDYLNEKKLTAAEGAARAGAAAGSTKWDELFRSPEAEAIKAEICAVGKKLWMRAYVDGNGGNISYRLTAEAVICTPTLMSKYDLRPEDLCLVDLDGNQLAGGRPRTSEILMHMEIYKAVPEAKAVVHCHPPHATAYAITGSVPPTCIIPEFEVFVGKVAISPYETPGTPKFAQTVIPFVKNHNTVLLSNHGIVCWADTVTHAEWYAEVVDTYAWTLMNAKQLGVNITHIPNDKAGDLLAIKQRIGLPDARLDSELKECQLCDLPEMPGAIAIPPAAACGSVTKSEPASEAEVDQIVSAVTDAVMAMLRDKLGK